MKSVFVISPYHYCHCVATLVEGLQKNGIKVFDDYISFDKDSYPSLVKIFDVFFEDDFEGLRFFRNDSLYKIDKREFVL